MTTYGDQVEKANADSSGTLATTDELRDAAKRALLIRIAQMAAGDEVGIENVAEALRAVEYV